MRITYYGHSCFLMETEGKKVLFNPFITPDNLAAKTDINTIKTGYLLLSHGHQDHVADVETVYKNTGGVLLTNFDLVSWFEKKGRK